MLSFQLVLKESKGKLSMWHAVNLSSILRATDKRVSVHHNKTFKYYQYTGKHARRYQETSQRAGGKGR